MFALLSRQSSRARNAYVCSSCLGHVDPALALPSRYGSTSAQTTNNAGFSTTARLGEEGTDTVEQSEAASAVGEDNGADAPPKTNRQLKRGRQRIKQQTLREKNVQKTLLRSKSNLSTASATANNARKIRQYMPPKLESLSDSVEALDALRKSMMEVSEVVPKPDAPISKKKAVASKTGTKKAKSAAAPVEKTATLPGGTKKVSKVKESTTKDKKPIKKKASTTAETDGERPVKGSLRTKKSPIVASDSKLESDLDGHVRKVYDNKGSNFAKTDTSGVKITRVRGEKADWAKKWIDAIASNQDGGSGFKRAILLKLIEKGNLSPKDVGPAVTLLRNAIQEDQERRIHSLSTSPDATGEFKSIRQAMQDNYAQNDARHSMEPTSARQGARNLESRRQSSSAQPLRITRQSSPSKTHGSRTIKLTKDEENAQDTNNPPRGTIKHEIESINASDLTLVPLDVGPLDVPKLSYGLERVLFNPGVYQLQDPRSRVFNFDPYLQTIMPVSEFDFSALKEYITSSRDTTLINIAKAEKRKYTGSTSSMTSALGHFHFLLSQWRPINADMVSKEFPAEFSSFTALQRGPTAIFLRYKDGVYAIDADKEFDTANILSSLGKSMEKLLTLPTEDFEKYRKPNSDQITKEEREAEEAFHYTTMGDFLMRSQLDAYDPRLPGTGMFDLKTRAVVSIRMDTSKYEEGSGYEIKQRHGEWESFEREYYDMIRAAFLKYSLQVRMGRMDGIFVAFHNTQRIFGFQYISLPEMDMALHGTDDTSIGDSEFKLSLDLLNRVLDRATARFPEKSIRLFFETRTGSTPFMYIFAEPVEEKDIDKIQTSNKAEIDEFESRVLGLEKEATEEEIRQAEWDNLYSKVEETMDQDESGLAADEEDAVDGQSADSGVWNAEEIQKAEDFIKTAAQEDGTQDEEEDDEDEDNDLAEVDEEEGEKEDGVANDQAEENLEDHEAEDENVEETEEHDITVDEQTDGISQSENHAEGETSEVELKENKEQTIQDDEFVPDEQDNQLEENSEDNSDDSLKADEESVEESPTDSEPSISLEDHSNESFIEEHEDPVEAEDSDDTKALETSSSESSETSLFTHHTSPSESTDSNTSSTTKEDKSNDMFAMTLTIRNKVNGQYLKRPENLTSADKWTVEYSLAEVKDPARARKLYNMAKERRAKTLKKSDKKNSTWNENYVDSLMSLAKKGREYRQNLDKQEEGKEKQVLDLRDVSKVGKDL